MNCACGHEADEHAWNGPCQAEVDTLRIEDPRETCPCPYFDWDGVEEP